MNAIKYWETENKVQILCNDTIASKTGRINGAIVLIEQMLNRDIWYFPCSHYIHELVLRSAFLNSNEQS